MTKYLVGAPGSTEYLSGALEQGRSWITIEGPNTARVQEDSDSVTYYPLMTKKWTLFAFVKDSHVPIIRYDSPEEAAKGLQTRNDPTAFVLETWV